MSPTISPEPPGPVGGRLAARLAAQRQAQRSVLVAYLTAGFPDPATSIALMQEVAAAGADVLEVGVPFSDPLADGPVIQHSSQVALRQGVTLARTLELVALASLPIPVVLFSYLNPVLVAGPTILGKAKAAGVAGVLITDLPVGADPDREAWLGSSGLDFIRLVAPTTPTDRMAEIGRHGSGFVYLISRLGVTGERAALPDDLPDTVTRLRSATSLPVCIGFGISTPAQAREAARLGDGVVVGSALVRAAGESAGSAISLTRALRTALDAG